jgi:hypothetical protein
MIYVLAAGNGCFPDGLYGGFGDLSDGPVAVPERVWVVIRVVVLAFGA